MWEFTSITQLCTRPQMPRGGSSKRTALPDTNPSTINAKVTEAGIEVLLLVRPAPLTLLSVESVKVIAR